ncbi:hypothetical protein M405DRAFT_907387 [Rhizopogon salebrosus TDB-379]|nr:hypothetical protein M405DRAFT_907387 [Rhizopogon salebrosus TDB-379]
MPVYRKPPVSTSPCINTSYHFTHPVSPPSPAYTESITFIKSSQSEQRSTPISTPGLSPQLLHIIKPYCIHSDSCI